MLSVIPTNYKVTRQLVEKWCSTWSCTLSKTTTLITMSGLECIIYLRFFYTTGWHFESKTYDNAKYTTYKIFFYLIHYWCILVYVLKLATKLSVFYWKVLLLKIFLLLFFLFLFASCVTLSLLFSAADANIFCIFSFRTKGDLKNLFCTKILFNFFPILQFMYIVQLHSSKKGF